jgi:3-mercaptopyruvate sulfurtransferase SseA
MMIAADSEEAMVERGYANAQWLWEPKELHARLNDPTPCLIDGRAGEEYSQRHIPRAQSFDLFGLSLSNTDPAPLKAFSRMSEYVMSFRGVFFDTTVVFYAETSDTHAAHGRRPRCRFLPLAK